MNVSVGDTVTQLQVNQFSHGLLNPGLGWLLSCLGSFIGLRCLTRAFPQPDIIGQPDVFRASG